MMTISLVSPPPDMLTFWVALEITDLTKGSLSELSDGKRYSMRRRCTRMSNNGARNGQGGRVEDWGLIDNNAH